MPLPHRRQPLARFIKYHDLSYQQVADILGCDYVRISSIVKGHTYPTTAEIERLEKLFDPMPIEVLLDSAMLEYRGTPGPSVGRKRKNHGAQ